MKTGLFWLFGYFTFCKIFLSAQEDGSNYVEETIFQNIAPSDFPEMCLGKTEIRYIVFNSTDDLRNSTELFVEESNNISHVVKRQAPPPPDFVCPASVTYHVTVKHNTNLDPNAIRRYARNLAEEVVKKKLNLKVVVKKKKPPGDDDPYPQLRIMNKRPNKKLFADKRTITVKRRDPKTGETVMFSIDNALSLRQINKQNAFKKDFLKGDDTDLVMYAEPDKKKGRGALMESLGFGNKSNYDYDIYDYTDEGDASSRGATQWKPEGEGIIGVPVDTMGMRSASRAGYINSARPSGSPSKQTGRRFMGWPGRRNGRSIDKDKEKLEDGKSEEEEGKSGDKVKRSTEGIQETLGSNHPMVTQPEEGAAKLQPLSSNSRLSDLYKEYTKKRN